MEPLQMRVLDLVMLVQMRVLELMIEVSFVFLKLVESETNLAFVRSSKVVSSISHREALIVFDSLADSTCWTLTICRRPSFDCW